MTSTKSAETTTHLQSIVLGIITAVGGTLASAFFLDLFSWIDDLPLGGSQLFINITIVLAMLICAVGIFYFPRLVPKLLVGGLFLTAQVSSYMYNYHFAFSHLTDISDPSLLVVIPKLEDEKRDLKLQEQVNNIPDEITTGSISIKIIKHYQNDSKTPFIHTFFGEKIKNNPFVLGVVQIYQTASGFEIHRFSPAIIKLLELGIEKMDFTYKKIWAYSV
jgi:hypothetical protein